MNPDPSTCLRCGGPVSEITRRCTRCGAERLAPRQRYAFGFAPPADRAPRPPGGGARTWLRAGQALALAAAVGIAMVGVAFAPGYDETFSITLAVAVVITGIALMVVSAFLGWWRASRPFIPFAGLVFVGFITFARMVFAGVVGYEQARRAEMDEQVAGFREAASSLTDTVDAFTGGDPGPPPSGAKARELWVLRRFMRELDRHLREVGERRGVEAQDAPEVFNTARYVAAAGSHPEVGRYWEGRSGYAGELEGTLPAWTDSTLRALCREAGMTRPQVDRVLAQRGEAAAHGPDRWALERQVADAALAYHRFLVSVDGRVSYDARRDRAMFDLQDELDRANLLEQRMNATLHEYQATLARHGDALTAIADSVQAGFP
jgi:hypothetical protein